MTQCEIFIAMNEDEGWVVSKEESEVLQLLAEQEAGWRARVIKVTVNMSRPLMPEATVTIADDVGGTVTIEA